MSRLRWLLPLMLLGGCQHGRPFTNSSADYNQGQLHTLGIEGELESVADAVVTIMEEQQAAKLVKRRDLAAGDIVLSFRVSLNRMKGAEASSRGVYLPPTKWFRAGILSASENTRVNYVAYGGLFYVELRQQGESVGLRAIGLPVVDGLTACPRKAAEFRDCKPARAQGEDSFAEEAERRAGVVVTGANEAEVLSGLMAQLQRKKWKEALGRPSNKVERAFDTEGASE